MALSENLHIGYKHTAISFLMLCVCWVVWLIPTSHIYAMELDAYVFRVLNGTVADKNPWSFFWMLMNHKNENWLNVVLMFGMHCVLVYITPKGKRAGTVWLLLFYWLILQVVLYAQNAIYQKYFHILRQSPYYVLSPINSLSELYANPLIKDRAGTSFPSGHAFVAALWVLYTLHIAPKNKMFAVCVIVGALPVMFARVISGAHWPSDVVYSMISAYFVWAVIFALPIHRYLQRLLSSRAR